MIDSRVCDTGFSLVELSVVLVIVGLVTSLAWPNLSGAYRSMNHNSDRNAVILQVESLSARAFVEGRSFSLRTSDEFRDVIQLPKDLNVSVIEPITVRFNGYCKGGLISLNGSFASEEVRIHPPFCRVRRD